MNSLSSGIRRLVSSASGRLSPFARSPLGSCVTSPLNTLGAESQKRWASKAAGGSTKNGRKSNPKYLGLKRGHGQLVQPGNIIVRQRGTKFHPAQGVVLGRDHTLSAKVPGYVHFLSSRVVKGRQIHGRNMAVRKYVAVLPNKPAGFEYIRQDIR